MRFSAGKLLKLKGPQGGYALVIMLVLLIAGSIYTVVHYLDAASTATNQTSTTARALIQARDALLGYAATYRESHTDEGFGYLPCPDTNGDGIAETTCNNAVSLGLLPYRTLGLPDLRDASGTCLWYAVTARFRNNPKSDPLNWDSQGLISINDASGSKALQAADDSKGGAVAVIFAAGPPLSAQASGRDLINTPCAIDPADANLYLEYTTSPFRQGPGLDANGAIVLNDQLLWLSSAEVFTRIRARSDFPTYLNAGIRGIQSALSFALPSPAAGNMLPIIPPASLSQSDLRFYLQWRDQFRYLKCDTTGSYCYTLGSTRCDGLLLFGGEDLSGQPRPSNLTASELIDRLFEPPTRALLQGVNIPLLAADVKTQYSSASRGQDLALCLSPLNQGGDMLPNTSDSSPIAVASEVAPSPLTGVIAPSNPVARYITGSGPAILQLGETGSTDTAYGCLWYPDALQLGATSTPVYLRAYFAATFDIVGQGFTFTLADADSSTNPGLTMCGKGGASLGYAGSNGITPSIDYPKLALELDTHKDTSFGDTDAGHLALTYWGKKGAGNDDNTHNAGSDPDDANNPINPPSGSAGYLSYAMSGTQYVRLELQRKYVTGTPDMAIHTLRAYISPSITNCPQFEDLSKNLSSFAAANSACAIATQVNGTLVMYRASGGAVPMKQIWLGFTSGQDTIAQRIFIQRFKLQVSQ